MGCGCITQEAQPYALWQPKRVKGRLKRREHMNIYGWFMLLYGRNHIVKQLSSNWKFKKKSQYVGKQSQPWEQWRKGLGWLHTLVQSGDSGGLAAMGLWASSSSLCVPAPSPTTSGWMKIPTSHNGFDWCQYLTSYSVPFQCVINMNYYFYTIIISIRHQVLNLNPKSSSRTLLITPVIVVITTYSEYWLCQALY